MVKVVCPSNDGGYFYMDNRLASDLSRVKKQVIDKDDDRVFIVDGSERVGKSVFAMQLAFFLDNNFDLSRVVYTPEDFKRVVLSAKKGQAIIFDEAFKGLSSRAVTSEVNKLLTSLMMEMGQKNLFIFIVMPSFFMLDKYVAIHRSAGLFHVRKKNGRRGFWTFFNREKKKQLYIWGKRDMTYSGAKIPKSGFHGRFYEQYVLDESKYRALKSKALKNIDSVEDEDSKFKVQRDSLIKILSVELGFKPRKLADFLKSKGFGISKSQIYNILK